MVNSLKQRMIFSYILVTTICIFFITIISNIFLEKQFKEYVMKAHEKKSNDIINSLKHNYLNYGYWNEDIVSQIGIDALQNGLIISIVDDKGEKIWDATVHNNGQCQMLLSNLAANMTSRYSNWQGGLENRIYPLKEGLKNIGVLQISFYGPFYYSDEDILFLDTLNKIFVGVELVSIAVAAFLGFIMARGISKPISQVTEMAEHISQGHFNNRIRTNSNILEIKNLENTINNLAFELESQEALRKRLTSDVAHELRTPLATLQSHMEAMIDGIWEPSEERLKSCHEELVRINGLVGDLEKLTYYESENLILNKSQFDLGELISKIILNFDKELLNKNITVSYKAEKYDVYADKDKISQVIINLISNAIKYTGEDGKISIEVEKIEDGIIFYVKDNGVGIANEDLPRIFDRFYRVDKSRTRITGGAGIGLTITKSIVEAHGGYILAESKVNKGSSFKVFLPDTRI